MNSKANQDFMRALNALPPEVRGRAVQAFEQFQKDPWDRALQFKRLSGSRDLWSVRAGYSYRALGLRDRDSITWLWIGTHSDYDELVRRWR